MGIVFLCVSVELAKVIDQWPHAGRKVNHSVHQLSQRNLSCNSVQCDSDPVLLMVIQHTKLLLCVTLVEPKTSRMKLVYHLFGMSARASYIMLVKYIGVNLPPIWIACSYKFKVQRNVFSIDPPVTHDLLY